MSRTAIATRIKAAPARKRRSLRLKLVVISASVIFVTIILSFIFIYSTSSRHLEDEIDNKGLLIVRILASLDDDYWIKAIKRETNYDPFVQIRGKFGYSNVRQISVLFNDPGLPKDPQSVALVPVKVELQNSNVIMTKDGVSIKEGICVTYGDKPLNDFSRTFDFIKKLSGGKELRFWLALSMMDIQKAKNDLWVSMLIPTIIALVIGIVASAVFSFYITKPVKTLIEDIAVVSKGNLDHKSDVSTNDEIGLLANKFNEMTGLLKVAHEREIQQTAMEHELSIARQIQANLLPKERFESEDVKLDALYKPSKEVGGDYYDYFSIDDDHLGIVVADVSGKGVPASIIMSMYRILLRTEAIYAKNLSSRETLIRVNEILAKDMKKGMFVTTFYMILNLKDKTLMLSSAGHNPIYYYKSGEKKMYNINPAGLALGIYSGKLFRDSLKEATITLENNDSVLAYTDGVIECTDSSYNFFGEDRLKSLFFQLAEHEPKEVVNTIFEKLCQFQGDSEQHDDITLVSLRRNK